MTEQQRLIELFHKHAWHERSCGRSRDTGPGECDCGFDAAVKEIEEMEAAAAAAVHAEEEAKPLSQHGHILDVMSAMGINAKGKK